ncbi:MAG: tRNA (adenosine(37)-N6)-dimethylallyltransferase MiaA [Sphingobacterium sp.]
MKQRKILIVVVGPTAVGKTAMSIRLAKYYRTAIISADSRQFYREMTIGTAKPNGTELHEVPHYFINSHSIQEEYTAGDFEQQAIGVLEDLFHNHDVVVAVGGSGLFVRALCQGLDDLPNAPKEIREALNERFQKQGIGPLQAYLKTVDPVYYQDADIQNPQRVIRALEVYEASGQPISSFLRAKTDRRPFDCITIGLNIPREELYDKINRRVDQMMEGGLLQEVEALLPYRLKPALLTVGYEELFSYLDGDIDLEDAVAKIKQNSRRYAKRQITWFKKYGDTHWFSPEQFDQIIGWVDRK